MIGLLDWSFLTEKDKLEWVSQSSPEAIVYYINSIQKNKHGALERLDKALEEIKLLREQIRKIPYLFAGHQ